jgi:hypothetical protein
MARPIPPDDHQVLSDFAGALLPGGLRFIEVWRTGAETVTHGLQFAVDDPRSAFGAAAVRRMCHSASLEPRCHVRVQRGERDSPGFSPLIW